MITRKLSDIPKDSILYRLASRHIQLGVKYTYTQIDKATKAETIVSVIKG